MFFKNSQNSKENTCARVSFLIKKTISKDIRKTIVPSFMFLFNSFKSVVLYVKKVKRYNFLHWTNEIKNKHTWFSRKIFVFYRKWKIKNVVLDVRSAAHLKAFWIKQGVLFFARLLCFKCVQRRARVIARLICRSYIYTSNRTIHHS